MKIILYEKIYNKCKYYIIRKAIASQKPKVKYFFL